MRCNKCGTISFDHFKQCGKCGQDLTAIANIIGQFHAPPETFSWLEEAKTSSINTDVEGAGTPETLEIKAIDVSELTNDTGATPQDGMDVDIDPEMLKKLAEDELFKEALDKVA